MKFSKILLIVTAFALIGLTLSNERSERSEAQYQATTQSLRVEVGYKEMLTPPNGDFSAKVLERAYKGVVTYRNKKTKDFVLQASMLKEGAFRSGIPFFTQDPEKFSTPGFSQIFIPVPGQDKVQFVPFVQFTQACSFDIAAVPLKMTCPVRTNVGAGMLGFEFADDVMDTEALTIVNQFNKIKTSRESEINRTIVGVLDAISRLKAKQKELQDASSSIADAYRKQTQKQKIIIALIRKQGDIDDQITNESEKYIGLTKKVEKAQKKIHDIRHKIRDTITTTTSIEYTIRTMTGSLTGPAVIAKLESDLQRYLQLSKYWIQGAVFHRIIDGTEAEPLERMVTSGNTNAFNGKIDDYFYPQ